MIKKGARTNSEKKKNTTKKSRKKRWCGEKNSKFPQKK